MKILDLPLFKSTGLNLIRFIRYRIMTRNIDLVEGHFQFWSSETHVNRPAFEKVIEILGCKKANIIETGTSAWGTDSTRLWDSYIRKYGGSLITIDVRRRASQLLRGQLSKSTECVISDSVSYLAQNHKLKADLYYLDSWDVDWQNPELAALHGLAEFRAIEGRLTKGNLILIDDTPKSICYIHPDYHVYALQYFNKHGVFPGKGAEIIKLLENDDRYITIFHEYAILLRMV